MIEWIESTSCWLILGTATEAFRFSTSHTFESRKLVICCLRIIIIWPWSPSPSSSSLVAGGRRYKYSIIGTLKFWTGSTHPTHFRQRDRIIGITPIHNRDSSVLPVSRPLSSKLYQTNLNLADRRQQTIWQEWPPPAARCEEIFRSQRVILRDA